MENIEKCELWQGDCLELMKNIPDGSVACVNTNRRFTGIELDEGYFNIAKQRIDEAIKGGVNG